MSDLESRYRTVLYWYPSSWREQNADAVVGTLMDEADATGRTRPRPAELASLTLNGIRARFGALRAARPLLATRHVVADLALGLGFAISLVMAIGFEWAPWAAQGWRDWPPAASVGFGPFASVGILVFGLWIAAFTVALLGRRRIAAGIATLSVPLGIAFLANRPDGRWAIYPPTEHGAFALVPSIGALLLFGLLAALSFLAPRVQRADRMLNARRLLASAAAGLVYVLVAIGMRSGWSLSSRTMFQFPGYEGRLWRSSAWQAVADVPLMALFMALALVATALVGVGWSLRGRSNGRPA